MMSDASRWKVPFMLAAIIGAGWVLADAMNVRLPTDPPLPGIESLLAEPTAAKTRLRSTAVYDRNAADLIATCLLHGDVELRRTARSVAHERLDQWQLDTPVNQPRMESWLAGSLVRRLKTSGKFTTPESEEIAKRIRQIAMRPNFVDGKSCLNDCNFVCGCKPKNGVSVLNADLHRTNIDPQLNDQLKQSFVAPAHYEE